jgi:hypothetical protein
MCVVCISRKQSRRPASERILGARSVAPAVPSCQPSAEPWFSFALPGGGSGVSRERTPVYADASANRRSGGRSAARATGGRNVARRGDCGRGVSPLSVPGVRADSFGSVVGGATESWPRSRFRPGSARYCLSRLFPIRRNERKDSAKVRAAPAITGAGSGANGAVGKLTSQAVRGRNRADTWRCEPRRRSGASVGAVTPGCLPHGPSWTC